MQLTDFEIRKRFGYHRPKSERVASAHEQVRSQIGCVAADLDLLVPDGREKSLGITALEEAMMWFNAGIARNQDA